MDDDLTLLELARRVVEPPERLREWRALRLIGREGRETYDAADVERVRVIQLLLRRGITVEAIARANDDETLLDRHVALAFPEGVGTLLRCHLGGLPIARSHDQPGGGGNLYAFRLSDRKLLTGWVAMERWQGF